MHRTPPTRRSAAGPVHPGPNVPNNVGPVRRAIVPGTRHRLTEREEASRAGPRGWRGVRGGVTGQDEIRMTGQDEIRIDGGPGQDIGWITLDGLADDPEPLLSWHGLDGVEQQVLGDASRFVRTGARQAWILASPREDHVDLAVVGCRLVVGPGKSATGRCGTVDFDHYPPPVHVRLLAFIRSWPSAVVRRRHQVRRPLPESRMRPPTNPTGQRMSVHSGPQARSPHPTADRPPSDQSWPTRIDASMMGRMAGARPPCGGSKVPKPGVRPDPPRDISG